MFAVASGLLLLLTGVMKPAGIGEKVAGLLGSFYEKYPQQKVYVSMDKPAYGAGESIWFKAYVLNATDHRSTGISTNLIVEINNSFGKHLLTRLCKIESGFAKGDFSLPDTMQQGVYELRAYTNWMRNFGESYIFTRQFNIWNPEHAPRIYKNDKIANKRLKKKSIRKAKQTEIGFYPEGGDLVAGLPSRVGFKAINRLGLGILAEGVIEDSHGERVAGFKSNRFGMGSFELTPEADGKYYALVSTDGKKDMKFKLPEIVPEGYVMKTDNLDQDKLTIEVRSTNPDATAFLVAHVRGTVCFTKEMKLSSGKAGTTISKKGLPTGVMHITLFDGKSIPRCERLVFIRQDDPLNISIETGKQNFETREKVGIRLRITDEDGNPVQGNFDLSVAGRELANASGDFQSDIVSNLWLVSDLAGPVQDPDYYLENRSMERRQDLDFLMMTQGWRRFRWDDVLGSNSMNIDYTIERGLIVEGKVTREFFDIPLKDLPVTLTVLSEFNDVYVSRTDDKGNYRFELPDYEDTVFVEVKARRKSGRKNLVIYVNEATRPESGELYTAYTRDMTIEGSNFYRPVVEVEDTTQPKLTGLYSKADNVIKVDETMNTYGSVLEIIQGRVPGVMVSGNSVQIRGPASFLLSTEPLYLIDNIPVDRNTVLALNPMDVDRIEILKGPRAAIYGSRGANGVISIYTKRGSFMRKGVIDFRMFGYSRAREFYAPKYGSEFDYLIPDDRTTLFWSPDITTDKEGRATLEFYNSDKTGDFTVMVEGISTDGLPGKAETRYTVR